MTEKEFKALSHMWSDGKEIEDMIQLLLPSEERTMVRLRYCEGLDVKQCAERMYVSKSTAYRMLCNAHKLLCEAMEARLVEKFVKRFEKYIGDCTFTLGQFNDIQNALRKATEDVKGGNK